ncbi:MAG: zinc ABC transporter substrate-binding protein [Proteobacteria bacterium]|nr:zinc ABC transporter substrate-binding protein [Pseudomonadota bacterium]
MRLRLFLALFLMFLPSLLHAHALNHPMKVIATISILGDFAKIIGGDQVWVYSLVGPDTDSYNYKPVKGDLLSVERADLVISNGLGLEGWLGQLLLDSKESVRVVTASKEVQARYGTHGGIDPHAWLNVAHAETYVQNIRDAFVATDPINAEYYKANATAYLYQLRKLDHWIKLQMGRIPKDKRKFVSGHDAFAYFAAAYGFTVVPIEGLQAEPDASATDFPEVLALMKKHKISTLFYENTLPPRVVREMVQLSSGKMAGMLYAEALSNDEEATNYTDMMKTNIRRIFEALEGPMEKAPVLTGPPKQ